MRLSLSIEPPGVGGLRHYVLRRLASFSKCIGRCFILVLVTSAQGQVVLPISSLQYDAPTLPPSLWPTTPWVARDLALLPVRTLEQKNAEQYQRPYHISVRGEYQDVSGTFGRLTLNNTTAADVSFEGDNYSSSILLSTKKDSLDFGAISAYEAFDLSSFSQQRLGIMPYVRWMTPLGQRTSLNLLSVIYYFNNTVDSHLAPREFSDYSTMGAGLSAALHFDTRYAYKAVSIARDTASDMTYVGSVAMTLQVQSDDAKREVVYQQNVVDEVDKQQLLVLAGNVGVRLQDRAAIVLAGEYGSDLSDYDGSLSDVDSNFMRVSLKYIRTLSADWNIQGGVSRVCDYDVEVTGIQISLSTTM